MPGRACLLAYFPDRQGLEDEIAAALATVPSTRMAVVPASRVDWVARFREGFSRFEAGGFTIVPEWDREPIDAARALRVDPGRAFGTGTHETTRLCLAAVAALARAGRLGRTLDVGTGTGILGIAAARLGAPFVVASDVDPEAVAAARRHAGLNGVSLAVVRADGVRGLRPGRFDLVLANITAGLLIDRRQEIAGALAPGGTLVLAGLLASEAAEVSGAYRSLGVPRLARDGDWASLSFGPGSAA